MRMTKAKRLFCVLSVAVSSSACAADDAETEAQLELLTWWSQASERAAIQAVIDENARQHPNVSVHVLYADSLEVLQGDMELRLADGTPPTAFQANLGGNALQWGDSAEALNARAETWRSAFQDSILEQLSTTDGTLVGVPVALTRQNNVYYNARVLDELGLGVPEGREGLSTWLEALAALGYTHPLCLGDQKNWVSSHVLFENIVPGFIGAERSRRYWSGELSGDDEEVARALDYAASLNSYWNPDFDEIDWDAGLQRLMQDAREPSEQCLMTAMGDWGGAVLSDDFVPGKDFFQGTWPGAEGLFVLAGDAFITVKGVSHQAAALDFFDTLASEAGQIAFNEQKGAVPARTLPDELRKRFGPLTQANMADLASGTAVPAYKVLGSSRFPWEELAALTHDFFLVGDKQPILDLLTRNYGKLARD
jgi:glucose/mannose transport system substrate-binding protein